MASSQRCKVTFGKTAAIPTRHYLLVGPEGQRFREVYNKVLTEYRNPNFDEGKQLASLYWIDSETDHVILDSQEAYESALAYIVPDQTGICYLKLYTRTRPTNATGLDLRSSSAVMAPYDALEMAPPGSGSPSLTTSDRQRRHSTAIRTQDSLIHSLLELSKPKVVKGVGRTIDTRKAAAPGDVPEVQPVPLHLNEQDASEATQSEEQHPTRSVGKMVRQRRHQIGQRQPLKTKEEEELDDWDLEKSAEEDVKPDAAEGSSISPTGDDVTEAENPENEAGPEEEAEDSTIHVGKAKFACTKCNRVFSKARQLRGHQTAHSILRQQHKHHPSASPQKKVRFDSESPNGLMEELTDAINGLDTVESDRPKVDRKTPEDEGSKMRLDSVEYGTSPVTPRKKAGPVGATVLLPKEDPFQCPHCPRVFDHVRQLRGHQAAHTNSGQKRHRRSGVELSRIRAAALMTTSPRRELGAGHGPSAEASDSSEQIDQGTGPAKKRRRDNKGQVRPVGTAQKIAGVDLSTNGTGPDHDGPEKSGGVAEGNFSCPKCARKFVTKRQLQGHQAFHSDKGKFVCPLCHKGFRTREVLESHQDDCNGLDPGAILQPTFSCVAACGKLFHQKKTLTQHRTTCGFVRESAVDGESILLPLGSKNGDHHDEEHDGSLEIPEEKAVSPVPFAESLSDTRSATSPPPLPPIVIERLDSPLPSPLRHTGLREKLEESSNKLDTAADSASGMPKFFIAL